MAGPPRRFYLSNVQPHPCAHGVSNVELPLLLTKLSKSERRKHVKPLSGVVHLTDRMQPLSAAALGGQEQRVTIARPLSSPTPLSFSVDQPTGEPRSQAPMKSWPHR